MIIFLSIAGSEYYGGAYYLAVLRRPLAHTVLYRNNRASLIFF